MKNALSGVSRAAKLLLFLLALTVMFFVGLISCFRPAADEHTKVSLSWNSFWNGTYFSSLTETYGERCPMWDFYYTDRVAPKIVLQGEKNPTLEKGTDYDATSLGFTATDNFDGDITDRVVATEEADRIVYTVTDSQGNTATAYRNVTFVDTTPPVLTLSGGDSYEAPAHRAFEDPGVQAIDLGDGDLSSQVQVTGTVNTRMPGNTATLTYTVTDSAGNTATATRNVTIVKDMDKPAPTESDKVIYLTFDDGPGPYTEKLLDVLDKYDIQVTFFVTDQFDENIDMIGEAYRRGHVIGIHTLYHDFNTIYSSVDAYFNDFQAMQDIIVAQTGQETNIFRFPGGSSNTISNFNPGIMTTLTQEATNRGLYYFDWNCDSGDAETNYGDSQSVFNRVTSDITYCDSNSYIVLQHDIKEFSVDAVEDIINWGLDNGYIFRGLSEDTPECHHSVNN